MAEDIEAQCPERPQGLSHSNDGNGRCAECGQPVEWRERKSPIGRITQSTLKERLEADKRWKLIGMTPEQEQELLRATMTQRQFNKLRLLRWIYNNRRDRVS